MATDPSNNRPFGLGPQDTLLKPVDALTSSDEKTVTMVFPRRVVLTNDDGQRIEFGAGIQEVPEHLAAHDYLKRNGVQAYDAPVAKEAISNAKSLEEAQRVYDEALANLNAARARVARSAIYKAPEPTFAGKPLEDDEPGPDEIAADELIRQAQAEQKAAYEAAAKAQNDEERQRAEEARKKAETDAAEAETLLAKAKDERAQRRVAKAKK